MKMYELKKKYEEGATVQKATKALINKQLKRVCKYKLCDVSLAFEREGKEYCVKKHEPAQIKLMKKLNKEKKERYYKKHNITFKKTIKRKVNSVSGIPAEDTLLYENYKEPLKKIEKHKGFGYYGTVAITADRTRVQCHACGNMFKSVSTHIPVHGLTAVEYKEMFGLSQQTALIGDGVRENRQKNANEKILGKNPHIFKGMEIPDHLRKYNEKVKSGEIKHKGKDTWSLERRNIAGNCPEQVLERIKDLADKLGKPPTQEEFDEHYHKRYTSAIYYQHGTFAKAVKKACGSTRAELRHPDTEALLDSLRQFYENHGRVPQTSDFNRGLLRDRGVYSRKFGSLNNARIEAGLKALLPMPFGPPIELNREQYEEYKATGVVLGVFKPSDNAIKLRRRRSRNKFKQLV